MRSVAHLPRPLPVSTTIESAENSQCCIREAVIRRMPASVTVPFTPQQPSPPPTLRYAHNRRTHSWRDHYAREVTAAMRMRVCQMISALLSARRYPHLCCPHFPVERVKNGLLDIAYIHIDSNPTTSVRIGGKQACSFVVLPRLIKRPERVTPPFIPLPTSFTLNEWDWVMILAEVSAE